MDSLRYDMIFAGGGLSALMLLRALLESGARLPERIALLDRRFGQDRESVHWSYWSESPSYYDRYALGSWRQAHIGNLAPQPIAPYTHRLVRSSDVLAGLEAALPAAVERLPLEVSSITLLADGRYGVRAGQETYTADWVFDSIPCISPLFPSGQPQALLSGTGIICRSGNAVFSPAVATLFDPLPSGGFAYVLPLSQNEALVESAYFSSAAQPADYDELLAYLGRRTDTTAAGTTRLRITHQEHGVIPLGLAPETTSGPRHILLGAKRGLIKPSAGYGILRIERESARLAALWGQGRELPVRRPHRQPWHMMDQAFLRIACSDPGAAQSLMRQCMEQLSLRDALLFLDERLSPLKMARLMTRCYHLVAPYISGRVAQEIAAHGRKVVR